MNSYKTTLLFLSPPRFRYPIRHVFCMTLFVDFLLVIIIIIIIVTSIPSLASFLPHAARCLSA